ncbi:MAG: hypothetical protein K8R76_01795 [Candidatus Aegiribacteria sp.]|nr:hypothetical protein [Candidatus Aegiribacteria sp.]
MNKRMSHRFMAINILLLGVFSASVSAQDSGEIGPVIGTFDSRCVAVAYYRSEEFLAKVVELKAEYEAALQSGNTERADELGILGPEQQQLAHEQVFSTGDIDEIIWMIWSELPAVAEETGVDVIVSTWDIIYRDEMMHFVDVTDQMVMFFNPSEETLGIIESMKGVPAIPQQFLQDNN